MLGRVSLPVRVPDICLLPQSGIYSGQGGERWGAQGSSGLALR